MWKTDVGIVAVKLCRKLMLEKVPGEVRGKLMLQKTGCIVGTLLNSVAFS